jgi:hypothetical protein
MPWLLTGDYFETCSCDYVCPCVPTNMAGNPTKGYCNFAMVFNVESGNSDALKLDGLTFTVIGHAPEIMGKGNWSVGLIVDERIGRAKQAITAIASGQAGGPRQFDRRQTTRRGIQSHSIPERWAKAFRLDSQSARASCEGWQASPTPLSRSTSVTRCPANSRLALAHATASHLHAFGLDWDDTSGNNNGHFAPFNWRSGRARS